jgi:hypothetical protein
MPALCSKLVVLIALAGMIAGMGAVATRSASATAESGPTLATAVRIAKTHVVKRFRIGGLYSIRGKRSKRNATFAAVTGYYRRPARQPNTWVVYVRAREGRWRVYYSAIGVKALEPDIRVPCDIWPPFSEPSC